MSSNLSDQDRKELFCQQMDEIFQKVDEALELQKQDKFSDAIKLLAPEVKSVDSLFQNGFLEETAESKYLSFDHRFGYMLYHFYENPQKKIRYAPYNYGKMYYAFGSILLDLQNVADARSALEKAMQWDPTNAEYALEHAETYKNDLEKFYELTKEIFRIAFLPKHMSRLYRNFGFYFVERELWDVAIQCFSLAYNYDHGDYSTKIIDSELRYIYEKSNRTETIHMNFDNLEKYAQEYDFPYGPASDVVLFAYHQGKMRMDSEEYEDAKFLLTIANDLAYDDEIKEMLDKVNSHIEQSADSKKN